MQATGEQIAEIDHRVDAMTFDVLEDGVERRDVAVNVGYQSYSHDHRIAAWAVDCNTAARGNCWRLHPQAFVFGGWFLRRPSLGSSITWWLTEPWLAIGVVVAVLVLVNGLPSLLVTVLHNGNLRTRT